MTDETTNLVLEHLKSIRASVTRLEDKVDTFAAEMLAVRQHLGGTDALVNHDHDDIASIKVRLERIERRLEQVE